MPAITKWFEILKVKRNPPLISGMNRAKALRLAIENWNAEQPVGTEIYIIDEMPVFKEYYYREIKQALMEQGHSSEKARKVTNQHLAMRFERRKQDIIPVIGKLLKGRRWIEEKSRSWTWDKGESTADLPHASKYIKMKA